MERGIGYPAVSDSDVKSVLIPLPPISEQQHIVDILRQADELQRLRREANQRANDLLPALFQEIFGEQPPEAQPGKIGDLIHFEAGSSIAAQPYPARPGRWGIL